MVSFFFRQYLFFRTPLFPDSRNLKAKENELCMEKDFFFPLPVIQNELFWKKIVLNPVFWKSFKRMHVNSQFFLLQPVWLRSNKFFEISSLFGDKNAFKTKNFSNLHKRVTFIQKEATKPTRCVDSTALRATWTKRCKVLLHCQQVLTTDFAKGEVSLFYRLWLNFSRAG